MKPSHFTTPRTLGDCHFAHNADPIELPPAQMDRMEQIIIVACVLALVACLTIIYWPA